MKANEKQQEFFEMVLDIVISKTGWSKNIAAQTVANYMEEVFIPFKSNDVFAAARMICKDFGF